jgi:hypothetical protein
MMDTKQVKFRDYSKYPKNIMDACHFRDSNDDLPDGAFFAMAREEEIYDNLLEMAEWENENTYEEEKK